VLLEANGCAFLKAPPRVSNEAYVGTVHIVLLVVLKPHSILVSSDLGAWFYAQSHRILTLTQPIIAFDFPRSLIASKEHLIVKLVVFLFNSYLKNDSHSLYLKTSSILESQIISTYKCRPHFSPSLGKSISKSTAIS
jgi:hypothetical protein